MTGQKLPLGLKKITQYIRRAEELDRDKNNPESVLVAYYCRQYAVVTGIPLATTSEAKIALSAILDKIEADKVAMANFTKEESYGLCRSFAIKVFDKADGEDREGTPSKETAKTFYAAASFLDVLKQFTEEDGRWEDAATEEEKKSFYAKWKATDILKAIKEGREPTSGGYGDSADDAGTDDAGADDDQEEESPTQISSMKEEAGPDEEGIEIPLPPPMPPPPVYPTEETEISHNVGRASTFDRPHFVHPSIPPVNSMPSRSPKSTKMFGKIRKSPSASPTPNSKPPRGGGPISKEAIKDAKELTKFATKALDSKDVDMAVERLKQALEVLGH